MVETLPNHNRTRRGQVSIALVRITPVTRILQTGRAGSALEEASRSRTRRGQVSTALVPITPATRILQTGQPGSILEPASRNRTRRGQVSTALVRITPATRILQTGQAGSILEPASRSRAHSVRVSTPSARTIPAARTERRLLSNQSDRHRETHKASADLLRRHSRPHPRSLRDLIFGPSLHLLTSLNQRLAVGTSAYKAENKGVPLIPRRLSRHANIRTTHAEAPAAMAIAGRRSICSSLS